MRVAGMGAPDATPQLDLMTESWSSTKPRRRFMLDKPFMVGFFLLAILIPSGFALAADLAVPDAYPTLAAALVLGIAEVLVPGFVFLGFAIGALAVSMMTLNIGLSLGLPQLLLLFAALSLVAWLVLRRLFALPKGQVKTFDHDIND